MTMGEYKNCEKLNEIYCLTVFKHKQAKAGPVRVILTPKLYEWLPIYVDNMRACVTKENDENAKVFVTWSGSPFQYSGGVSVASNALWSKAGMKNRIGANKFRKAAVSAV